MRGGRLVAGGAAVVLVAGTTAAVASTSTTTVKAGNSLTVACAGSNMSPSWHDSRHVTLSCTGTPSPSGGGSPSRSGSPSPSASPTGSASTAATVPSDVLDLRQWNLTLPVDDAKEVAGLVGYSLPPYFTVTPDGSGVLLRAPVGGQTTANSSYPRSELRELVGGAKAAWSSKTGTHSMTATVAVTHLPFVKPQVVVGQVHDPDDDVIEVLATGTTPGRFRLGVRFLGSEQPTPLIGQVALGARFSVSIVVTAGGRIAVSAGGGPAQTFTKAETGLYFKMGCYTQSNTGKGDAPTAYGETVVYDLAVSHTG